jgi:glutamate-1-semialdehyde 2,1-aminomutase
LRAACDRAGALLIFDEVISGFRLGPGGAQARFTVTPDLTCFGKVIGGGLPIGALGGRAELMHELAPLGPVYQAGTLSGNPLATAAGLAALDRLDADAYAEIERKVAALAAGLAKAIGGAGVAVTVPVLGTLFGVHLAGTPAVDYDTARLTDTALYARLFHALLRRGVAMAPGAFEVGFVGLAHTDADLDRIVDAAGEAAAEAARTV